MTTHPKRSRPLTRSRRQGFRPEVLGLEERTMMASGLAATSAQTARSANEVATSVILGEITTFVAGQPLAASLATRLNRGIKQATLTRDGAIERIIQTPQVEASLVQSLTEEMLNRAPTPAESRALIAGTRGDGADVPKILVQMMSTPEYYNDQGGTNTGFVQAAAMALLNRPASPDELATDVTRLDRGGAAARTQFLQTLTAGREFRLAETQDAYQQFAGTSSTSKEQASALKAYQGPTGYTKMLAQVLGSDAGSTGIVPTLAENSGLSVKRVPGFLAGWTVPNLAAPYDVANVSNRSIDNTTVDYWAITLNALDSVLLTIVPQDGLGAAGFAVRIWGPDGKEIGTAVTQAQAQTQAQVTFVAKTAGTYTLGISTSENTGYSFLPDVKHAFPTSGTTLRTYRAEFQTYPGTNTNTVAILQNYKNPAYTNNNWPTLTAAQSQAYQTLTMIARANSQVSGGDLDNFTDFEQVSNQTDPEILTRWLTATWTPIQNLLSHASAPNIIGDTYKGSPVIQTAYSPANFETFATALLGSTTMQAAYESVHQLLLAANNDRSNIDTDFLQPLESWSTSNAVFTGQDATDIANLMTYGVTKVPATHQAVSPYDWIKNLLGFVLSASAGVAGAVADGLAPGSGIFVGAGVYTAGNVLVNLIDASLDATDANQKFPQTKNIADAANEMDNLSLDAYKDAFDLLTNKTFLTSVFSNFGLLEAMGNIQFTSSFANQITPAAVLKQDYDRSVWQQLLPQMYSWKLVSPTDNGPADTLPNFTFFIPYIEDAQWETPASAEPYKGTAQFWDYYPQEGKIKLSFPGSYAQAITEAKAEVVALQSGTANIPFPGYDVTPSDTPTSPNHWGDPVSNDWFGPGPVSTAQAITGRLDRFYTISIDSHLSETLYRTTPNAGYGYDGNAKSWKTWADLEGITIHQWALETPDGTGGFDELSQDAAKALFGTGSLVTDSANPVPYKDGGSYFDFDIPGTGLVTRLDAFTQWGKDIVGYAPKSLQPPDVLDGGNMNVGRNKKNLYYNEIYHSYVTEYTLKN
jgi:hypothetical protein